MSSPLSAVSSPGRGYNNKRRSKSGVESAGSWDSAALVLAGPRQVRDLFVEGRRIVASGQIATLDIGPVLHRQRALARGLAK